MDENENREELNLEDILKEFSAPADEEEAAIAAEEEARRASELEEAQPEPEADGKDSSPEEDQTGAMDGQTIRMDPAAIQAATKPMTQDQTIRFTPVGQEPKEAPQPESEPVPEGAEPFSANWEPEYEQPMGEYIPPEPIVFRPRSRLHELKRKLIAGPERRYYALSEQGLGRLQISIFLSMLVVILSFVAIALHQFGLVQENRMRLLVFGEVFAMLLSALLGSSRLVEGFTSVFKGRFTPDTLLLLSFLVCMGDGFFCLQQIQVPFCAAFCLEMTMSIWGEYQRRNTEMGQMDTLRKATRLNRVAKAPDCYEDRPGFYVVDGEPEDFMDTYAAPSAPEKLMNGFCLIGFAASAGVAAAAWFTGGSIDMCLHIWSAAILAVFPATGFIALSRPMAVLERRFHRLGVVLCGWKGIKAMSGPAAVPLKDTDLFPAGSMKINGVKFYSRRDPEQTLEYAAAVINESGCNLAPLFTQLLDSRNGKHYEASSFRCYTGGFGGEVCGESVLVGIQSFLQDMGVELPDGTRVNQAVYVAVDGELCGVFALAFGKLKGVAAGLGTLCGYRGLTPVLSSNNFLLDEGFLRSRFSVNTRRLTFPSPEERQAVSQWSPEPEESIACALTTQDGLAPAAFAITGARALRSCMNLGTIVQIIGGCLGLAMVLILTLVDGGELLTPANLLLLHLVWAIPGLLITEWTRHL